MENEGHRRKNEERPEEEVTKTCERRENRLKIRRGRKSKREKVTLKVTAHAEPAVDSAKMLII